MVTASPLFHGNLRYLGVPQALLMTVSHDHWGNWIQSVKASLLFQKTLILEESAVFFRGEWWCSTCVLLPERDKKKSEAKRKMVRFLPHLVVSQTVVALKAPPKKSQDDWPNHGEQQKNCNNGSDKHYIISVILSAFWPGCKKLAYCSALPGRRW